MPVHAPEIRGGEEKVQEKLSDLALLQKVQAKLIAILGVDFRQAEVRAEKGIVVLRGRVGSQVQKENCQRAISGLEAVNRIENCLSVVSGLW
jgi:osmotically-inducible protein OsmY